MGDSEWEAHRDEGEPRSDRGPQAAGKGAPPAEPTQPGATPPSSSTPRGLLIGIVVAVAAVAIVAVGFALAGGGTDDASSGLIACSSIDTEDEASEIFVVDVEGVATQLTDSEGRNRSPEWSPDGDRLVFRSERDGDSEIFVMAADGSNQRQLTDNTTDETSPTWSPDGERIAYQGPVGDALEIFVVDVEDGEPQQLTDDDSDDFAPEWSPDGDRIVFMSDRTNPTPNYDGDGEFFVMDSDGGNVIQLTDLGNDEGVSADWSPDGDLIAFGSNGVGGLQVYTVRPDGGDLRPLTDSSGASATPSWSPDGDTIAFISNRDGDPELYLMDADGSEERVLTQGLAGFFPAQWSADSGQIAYAGSATDFTEAQVIDIETGDVTSTGQQCHGRITWAR